MKPDWDKLMEKFDGHPSALVGDVDCTAEGKPLCDSNGVRGYPTIKFGDPSNLEDYQGGRAYDDLEKFANENLKPSCSPSNIELCDDEKKAEIAKFQALSDEDLKKAIADKEAENAKAESDFKTFVEGLQKQYQDAMAAKDAKLDEIKKSGLGLMKAVAAAKSKATTGSDEL